jgi:hypothetical protein
MSFCTILPGSFGAFSGGVLAVLLVRSLEIEAFISYTTERVTCRSTDYDVGR